MRYWWVNQNQTYDFEVPGGFLWSPKTRADGGRNHFYEVMAEVKPGDFIFSFCDTSIKAIGIVQRAAVTSPKPDFRTAGSNWADEGWYVEVEFAELANPFKPREFMDQIGPLLAEKYAPLQPNGNGLQGIYLTEISKVFGELLSLLSKANIPLIQSDLAPTPETESEYETKLEIESESIQRMDEESNNNLNNDPPIKININIYRYKFTPEFMSELYQFSKIHQYDHRKAAHLMMLHVLWLIDKSFLLWCLHLLPG